MVIQLMPHQTKAVKELSNGKVLVGGVGTGKTITSLVYFYEKMMGGTVGDPASITNPMDIYVFTTARKRDSLDWQIEASHLSIGVDRDASVAGIKLTVDSYNNIGNYTHIHGAFIILDEQRMVGSGSWTKAFLHMAKSNKWIMLSATPGDVWTDYIPLFIANGFYKNRTQFKRDHCVYSYYGRYPKLESYINEGKLIRLRDSITVKMPYDKHTTRHLKTVHVEYDKLLFEQVVKKRWHVYEQRPLKDVSELFSVMRKVVNSDSSRLATVRHLLMDHPRLIVFYNFDYELEMLRTLGNFGTVGNEHSLLSNGISGKHSDAIAHPNSKSSTSNGSDGSSSMVKRNGTALNQDPSPSMSSQSSSILECYESRNLGTLTKGTSSTLSKQKVSPGTRENTSVSSKTDLIEQLSSPRNVSENITIAEWNGHKHQPVPTSDRWVYLVQYVAGAEAWNCTATDAVAFFSLTYSYKNFEQAQGRIDRLDTPFTDLQYFILMSEAPIDRAVAKALKHKKNFNEREFGT